MPTRFRDLIVAFSLSNLLFLKAWKDLLEGDRHPYFRIEPAAFIPDSLALLLDVLLVAALLWLAATWLRRRRNRFWWKLTRWVFVLTVVRLVFMVANMVQRAYPVLLLDSLAKLMGKPVLIAIGVVLVGSLLFVLVRWHDESVTAAITLLLIFSPFVFITFGRALWVGAVEATYVPAPVQTATQSTALPEGRPRALWFIFDGMDYRLAFSGRPADVNLPEFDRLRAHALFADHAISPGAYTLRSVASLLSGAQVVDAEPTGADDLSLALATGGRVALSGPQNLFAQARALGARPAAAGWYYPYCRVFRQSLDACHWEQFRPVDTPVWHSMLEFLDQASPPFLRTILWKHLELRDPIEWRRKQIAKFVGIREAVKRLVADPNLDLIFVHWPIPHEPIIYDRKRQDFSLERRAPEGYLDNLVLADRTLGAIRQSLEQAGLWDRTAILISADHPYRESIYLDGKRDPRVPYILKLPDEEAPITYQRPFQTVVTRDLLLALLRGDITTPQNAVLWLDQHANPPPP